MPSWRALPWALATMLAMTACKGDDPETKPDPNPDPESCSADASMVVPMQRIDPIRYRQVIDELFGADIVFDGFPRPLNGYPYSTYSDANPAGASETRAFMEVAEAIAIQVADRIPACGGDETSCANDYLSALADKSLRRPATTEELAILNGVYATARAELDYPESVALAVSALLQMPQFLYLLETQPEDDAPDTTLDGQEIAQRMAMLFGNGLPDDELLSLAASGALTDPETRREKARRMLDEPRGHAAVTSFMRQWLMIDGFHASVHDAAVQAALDEELRLDLESALASADGLNDLLRSPHTHVNSVLESFYGLTPTSAGPDDWREVDLDPAVRVGILTHPLLLAKFAHGEDAPSVILRGKFVRMNLLCGDIAPPPAGAQQAQADLTPEGATPREQAEARLNAEGCGTCHKLMDPIGFGFSAFDGAGHYVPTENGAPVDDAGTINPPSELAGDFHGVRELGEDLAASPEVRACFAKHWIRYSFGKHETITEACSTGELAAQLADENLSILDLLAALAASPAFVDRKALEAL
ncbi:MAG: DUF1588 domain-containing protein [Polyangiaceae bacterium]